eukprot:TRINITY_DN5106_c0_g1_i3.p1 TRINITY_DN5106_c0_g1~~TRINITY_DN5106_c0_g1_i3.p1  ORF type:complete len:491 (-),score=78.38 TRINITY_DN5106_c0_g1_i3:159-1631(-)
MNRAYAPLVTLILLPMNNIVHSARDADSSSEDALEAHSLGRSFTNYGRACEIDVVVENLSGKRIDKLMIIHKHLGLDPPTHIMEWESIEPNQVTDVRKLSTEVGTWALRNDWWLATWTFEKSNGRCSECEKGDGTCATWLTVPSSKWLKTLLDPNTYVKAAVTTVGFAVDAASAGTLTTVSIALGGMVTSSVANRLLSGNIDGFKVCGIKEEAMKKSREGKPMKIVILPEPDESKAVLQPVKLVIRQYVDDEDNCEMGATPMSCDRPTRTGGEVVSVQLKNAASRHIKHAVLLHRFRGLDPSLEIMAWGRVGIQSTSEEKATMTKTRSMYDDMWMMAWAEDGVDDCLVKSTVPETFWEALQSSPDLAAHMAASHAGHLLVGDELSVMAEFTTHIQHHGIHHPSMGWGSEVEETLGKEALFHLASTQDIDGFIKCNLETVDLKDSGQGPIEIEVRDGEVVFRLHDRTCRAEVTEKCRQTEACTRKKNCQKT